MKFISKTKTDRAGTPGFDSPAGILPNGTQKFLKEEQK